LNQPKEWKRLVTSGGDNPCNFYDPTRQEWVDLVKNCKISKMERKETGGHGQMRKKEWVCDFVSKSPSAKSLLKSWSWCIRTIGSKSKRFQDLILAIHHLHSHDYNNNNIPNKYLDIFMTIFPLARLVSCSLSDELYLAYQ
jgi:hypothetical protein